MIKSSAILLVSCPDQKGITAKITDFIYRNNGNVLHADQHIDEQTSTFFIRIEWDLKGFKIPQSKIKDAYRKIAMKYKMNWEISFTPTAPKIAIFASKQLHCLQDILLRVSSGQLNASIPVIISNHDNAQNLARKEGIDFHLIPITKKNKRQQEKQEAKILKSYSIDLIILARYHQILTPVLINKYKNKIINIHHSFLPAFPGKNPYKQAFEKGVKIIGATSHYVTKYLDEGPIIAQDTTTISHRDNLDNLIQKGKDLEEIVLFRAVKCHLERKILIYNKKTVNFD